MLRSFPMVSFSVGRGGSAGIGGEIGDNDSGVVGTEFIRGGRLDGVDMDSLSSST